jgi:hypothetical protein
VVNPCCQQCNGRITADTRVWLVWRPLTCCVSAASLQGGWLHRVTAAWQSGRVSNFDYLLYLNLAAGRSFNDLAQWPVFPWVLSSYVTQVHVHMGGWMHTTPPPSVQQPMSSSIYAGYAQHSYHGLLVWVQWSNISGLVCSF